VIPEVQPALHISAETWKIGSILWKHLEEVVDCNFVCDGTNFFKNLVKAKMSKRQVLIRSGARDDCTYG